MKKWKVLSFVGEGDSSIQVMKAEKGWRVFSSKGSMECKSLEEVREVVGEGVKLSPCMWELSGDSSNVAVTKEVFVDKVVYTLYGSSLIGDALVDFGGDAFQFGTEEAAKRAGEVLVTGMDEVARLATSSKGPVRRFKVRQKPVGY